ncbi:MAG TPA: FHA domain-containing protein [Polyangiaceae bacterium]|nr:FHA domain-containing protein [Polyangiaceae bacterium]
MDEAVARSPAARVAKWLLGAGRAPEAVALLSACAATGNNDKESHELLAEALRIDPSSPLAKLAFERMEGIQAGDHAPLEDAIAVWTPAEIGRLEREIAKPAFRRAQVGFNNNVKYKGLVFHIQTEDSGLDKPHLITHLFADGGRVIKSHKRSYAHAVHREDIAPFVRALMKGQHMEMAILLRTGTFDPVIEGRAVGGMEVLEHEPVVEVQKLAAKEPKGAPKPPPAPVAPPPTSKAPPLPPEARRAAPPKARATVRLRVLRGVGQGPQVYEGTSREVVLGRSGEIPLHGDRFCHPREAVLRVDGAQVYLCDLEAGNGVFLRVRRPVELEPGDQFIVGDQVLTVEMNPQADDGPSAGPTYFYSSPKWPSSFRLVQLFEGGGRGACVLARGTTMQLGREVGDFVFPNDPLVGEPHCLVEEQAGAILLTDLGSQSGVFVKIKGDELVVPGDEIIVGRTRLLLEAPT